MRRTFLVVSCSFAIAACNSTPSGPDSGTFVPDGGTYFIGTWTVTGNGSVTLTSVDGGAQTASGPVPAPNTYQLVFGQGTTTDLVSQDSFGCRLLWDISNGVAG